MVRSLPSSVTPMATRFTVPNRLARQGIGEIDPSARTGFSNSTAGPPVASRRVQISVISSTVRHRLGDPHQLALGLEPGDEVTKGAIGHGAPTR